MAHEHPTTNGPDLTDDEFVRAFLTGAIPPDQFHHRDHLRLAWGLVRQQGAADAEAAITTDIRRYATHHGQAAKYHDTMTRFWVRLVAHAQAVRSDLASFDRFIAAYPWLLDKTLPYRHWSREAMDGPTARAGWVEPDLLALPA